MIKTGKELAAAAVDVAKNYKTLYVAGAFGWPMTAEKKERAKKANSYNRQADRVMKIDGATADTFGFDCVCFIKALLWGWKGDKSLTYGGAVYGSNGVPDVNESVMIGMCNDVTTDFSKIQKGEVVWMPGHIGVYVGNGLVAECTPAWRDGVQITAALNVGTKKGYNSRVWTSHGKLPWVTYDKEEPAKDYTLGMRYLQKGCKGEDVKALQILLMGRGYSCGDAGADGDFGAATDKAVKKYQQDCEIEVDGIAGADTLGRLLGVM